MYRKILVALDHSKSDARLIAAIGPLARTLGAKLLLVHVADGWVARNYDQLKLSDSEEMREDRAYLDDLAATLRGQGLSAESHLARGEPPAEILRVADEFGCDLIALSTHGHRLLGDLVHGDTIEKVRHRAHVPLFIVSPGRDSA